MLVALNQQLQLKTLLQYSKTELQQLRRQQWFCPQCRQPVFLRAGQTCVPHFAHYRRSNCQLAHETALHLAGKQFLYRYFNQRHYQCQLEYFLPTIQQRPDLLLTRGEQRLAVEYQCSPLSLAQLQQRTVGYQSIQLPVLWILGPGYLPNKLQNRQLRFLNYTADLGYYLLFLTASQFLLWHHVQQQGLPLQYSYQVHQLNPATPLKTKPLQQQTLIQQLDYLQRQLYQGRLFWQKLQLACYQQRRHLLLAPLWCHQSKRTLPLLKCSTFALRVYFLLAFEQQPVIQPQALTQFRHQHQRLFQATGRQFGQQQVTVLTNLVNDLVAQGYLKAVRQGWQWQRWPAWFDSFQVKWTLAKKTSQGGL